MQPAKNWIAFGTSVLVAFIAFRILFRRSGSNFKSREFERGRTSRGPDLERARFQKIEAGPVQLTGFREDAPAHEVLGVSEDASPDAIQIAFREQMKRFHPDKFSGLNEHARADAEKIAKRILAARAELLGRRSTRT